jgi:hypothetical protein
MMLSLLRKLATLVLPPHHAKLIDGCSTAKKPPTTRSSYLLAEKQIWQTNDARLSIGELNPMHITVTVLHAKSDVKIRKAVGTTGGVGKRTLVVGYDEFCQFLHENDGHLVMDWTASDIRIGQVWENADLKITIRDSQVELSPVVILHCMRATCVYDLYSTREDFVRYLLSTDLVRTKDVSTLTTPG